MFNSSVLLNFFRGERRLSFLVLFKMTIASVLAVFFLADLKTWQSIQSADLYLFRITTFLIPFLGLVSSFLFRKKVAYSKLILFVCSLEVVFLCLYALFNPVPLNLFVGLLSLNLVASGLFLAPLEVFVVFSLTIFAFVLFLEDRLLLNTPYMSFYLVFNCFSFLVYSVSSFFIQRFFIGGSSALDQMSQRLMTQEELNQAVLSSVNSAVLTGKQTAISALNKSGDLFLEDYSSDFLVYIASGETASEGLFKIDSSVFRVEESLLESSGLEYEKVWLVTDVTEEVRTQRELEQSRKLSAIGQLSAGLAHEIRNPLAGISGSVELIKNGGLDDGDKARLFSTVLKEIDRLNALVTDFLGFASPEVKKVDEIQTQKFFEEMISLIKLDPRSEGVELVSQLENQSLMVDEHKIKQVFINLIINAFQAFSKEKSAYAPSPKVSVTGRILDTGYEIKVEDNGDGIKKENLASIFEPFHTTKDKGTGLGLALSHRILDGHGASIDVESAVGSGTTFTVLFKK